MSFLKFFRFRALSQEKSDKQGKITPVKEKRTSLERIHDALGARICPDDTERADLPVGMLYEDIIPVSGSVLIATGKVISRREVDKALDKALKV